MSGLLHSFAEEILWHLQVDAAAVAGLAVRIDGAAVPDGLQRIDGARHDFAARLAVDSGDEANATGVVLIAWRIGVAIFQLLGVRNETLYLRFALIFPPPFTGEGDREAVEGAPSAFATLGTSPVNGGGKRAEFFAHHFTPPLPARAAPWLRDICESTPLHRARP